MSTAPQTQTTTPMSTPPPPAPPKGELQVIALKDIRESNTNPRRNFDKKKLEELASSIRQHGVLEPLILRPSKGKSPASFEIIAGARRYRAAQTAQLDQVNAVVLNADDRQALEMQVIENQQRADLHPMEEAHGYSALMKPPHRMKAADIATRVSKSEKYVYDRVKLLDCIKPVQDVFWDHEIDAGHAILLARIPAEHQKRILEDPVDGLFRQERVLHDPEQDKLNWGDWEDSDDAPPKGKRRCVSVRELEAIIDRTVRFTAKDAIQNPLVYPETAQTLQEVIRPDGKEADAKVLPITYQHILEDTARDGKTRTLGPRSWTRADGQHASKTCDHSELGLVVAGPRRGEAFQVCRAKDKCTVHYSKEIKAKQKREREAKTDARAAKDEKTHLARQRREAAERQRREERQETWKKAAPQIQQLVWERVKTLPAHGHGFLADLITDNVLGGMWNRAKKEKGLKKPVTAEDLVRFLGGMLLADEAANEYSAPEKFPKIAKHLGIDKNVADILKAHTPKEEKPAQAKAKAKA